MRIIHVRFIFRRDPPFDAKAALTEIRRLTGWGTGDLAFVLNVARGNLWQWEEKGGRPNVDDADAIRSLLEKCRNYGTPKTKETEEYARDDILEKSDALPSRCGFGTRGSVETTSRGHG